MSGAYRVRQGLATLGPEALGVRALLEARILTWAAEVGAAEMAYPPLMRVADLARLDYFQNFPHLALMAAPIDPDHLDAYAAGRAEVEEVPPAELSGGRWALPSAACYNVYFHLAGRTLEAPHKVTTVAQCFRNEERYEELRRLWGFSMREVVCVGDEAAVEAHLTGFKERIVGLADALGLGLESQTASDPFYQPESSRAVMQKLFPQKEELVYGGSVAIASLNHHRNFFGERCNIALSDGRHAFSGCAAFGIERWLHALFDRFEGDADAIAEAFAAAAPDRPAAAEEVAAR